MANTVEQLQRWGVGLRSYSEPWLDTSGASPVADLTLNILASFAQFEKALIAERVCAGMARAKREGKHVGRPQKVNGEWEQVRPLVEAKTLSLNDAAKRLGVSQHGAEDRPEVRAKRHVCRETIRRIEGSIRLAWAARLWGRVPVGEAQDRIIVA